MVGSTTRFSVRALEQSLTQRRRRVHLAWAGICVTASLSPLSLPASAIQSRAVGCAVLVPRSFTLSQRLPLKEALASTSALLDDGPLWIRSQRGLVAARRSSSTSSGQDMPQIDPDYPGTAVERMRNICSRVRSLSPEKDLAGAWEDVRRKLLWAGGLRDLTNVPPGQGYTGHAFNDDNHCDLTAMLGDVSHNQHEGNVIAGIARGNLLGPGIERASLPELGPGGSWSTCTNGCHSEPPVDVAHVQFQSRVAFKLVWCPPDFTSFVLVDDEGKLLNHGTPTGNVPYESMRKRNYLLTKGGRYALEAEAFGLKRSG